jgi:hypothetical protein
MRSLRRSREDVAGDSGGLDMVLVMAQGGLRLIPEQGCYGALTAWVTVARVGPSCYVL